MSDPDNPMRFPGTSPSRLDPCVTAVALLLLSAGCRSASPDAATKPQAQSDEPGFIVPAGDVRLWVRSVGSGPTLVVVNGGPGASHHAIGRLESLASPSLRVVLYD